MSFVGRARSSIERGDTLRAVLTLVAGLRREPGHEEATRLLVDLVRDDVNSTGIEHEIAQVFIPRADRDELLREMVEGLRARGEERIADQLEQEGRKRGIGVVVEQPEPEPEPEPAPPEPVTPAREPTRLPVSSPAQVREIDPVPDSGGMSLPVNVPSPVEATAEAHRRAVAEERLQARRDAAAREREATRAAKRKRRTMIVVIIAVAAGLAGVGWFAYNEASRASDFADAQDAVIAFDRFAEAPLQKIDAVAGRRSEADVGERREFLRALAGEPVEVRLDGWTTAWGLAASAISALQKGDIENALALVTKTERLYQGELPALFARAMLDERRGHAEGARAAANKALDKHPGFGPAHEVVIRVSAAQYDFASFEAAVARLAKLRPDHPYAKIGAIPDPKELLLGPRGDCAKTEIAEGDAFVTAISEYRALCGAHDAETIVARATASLDADDTFVPARLALAAGLAEQGDTEGAAGQFTMAANLATSRELRLLIQAAAPVTLISAGRTDLAAPFTTPFPKLRGEGVNDSFDEQIGEARNENLRKGALADVTQVPWAAEALYARAEYFAARGKTAIVQAMLQELATRGVEPQRSQALAALWAPDDQPVAESDQMTKAINDARAGSYRAVFQMPLEGPGWWLPVGLQLRARAGAALGQASTVLAELDHAPIGLARRPLLRRLKLVPLAHLGRSNVEYEKLRDEFTERAKRVGERAVLAEALTWQVELNAADAILESLKAQFASNHQLAWTCVLYETARRNDEARDECLAAAGRDPSTSPGLLVEQGYYALRLGRDDDAVNHFAAAMAIDPEDEFAARGWAEANVEKGKTSGAQAIADRLADLGATASPRVRGAMNLWLAVALDAAEGAEQAQGPLAEAVATLGEDELAGLRGAFFAAREDQDAARRLFESALAKDPRNADAHVGLAKLLIAADESDAAREHLKRYLELEPKGRSAGYARRQLQ